MTAPIPGAPEAADWSELDHVLERLPRLGADDAESDLPLKSRCTVYEISQNILNKCSQWLKLLSFQGSTNSHINRINI